MASEPGISYNINDFMDSPRLSKITDFVVSVFEKEDVPNTDKKISVNPVVSKFATWYEKLRNVMEYQEEEVILRAAIERILKRRLILGGSGRTTAEPLVRELVWARYFPDGTLPESMIKKTEEKIDLYLALRVQVVLQKKIPESVVNEYVFHLLSSDLEKLLNFDKEKETISNFMFYIMKKNIVITDEAEETKDAQTFISIRRSFANDDLAFLRYGLFKQLFGELTQSSLGEITKEFASGYKEIEKQLSYKRKDRIFAYIKSKTAVFIVLKDLLQKSKKDFRKLLGDEKEFKKAVFKACEIRYADIAGKVKRAIFRSVLFILITKAAFALSIEGSYERLVYGKVIWSSIAINTSGPALLMLFVGLFIKIPDRKNSEKIFEYIKETIFSEDPNLGEKLKISKNPEKTGTIYSTVFTILWFLAFLFSFGVIVYILTRFGFNFVSQGIFIFFVAIVSFLTYRIWLTSKTYSVETKQGLLTPVTDFFFMPVVRVGRKLTEGISQFNFILFIFDFIIETPFKALFAFFEQWFFFLRSKSEELE